MVHFTTVAALLSTLLSAGVHAAVIDLSTRADGVNVLVSNDDGWAEANVRAFYSVLNDEKYNVVISAPASDQSGSGSSDATPKVLSSAGEYNTIPSGSPAIGTNSSDPRLNYVNSYPVTSVKYGISTFGPKFFSSGKPDIVVTGPNVGNNAGVAVLFSGTIGAAVEGLKQGYPAIAFSGATGAHRSYTGIVPGDSSTIYAQLATKILDTVVASGKPYLPVGIALNVNFPAVSSTCATPSAFKYILSRIYWNPLDIGKDVEVCGSKTLPTESSVIGTGCQVSISIMISDKTDSDSLADQQTVYNKLKGILSCPQ